MAESGSEHRPDRRVPTDARALYAMLLGRAAGRLVVVPQFVGQVPSWSTGCRRRSSTWRSCRRPPPLRIGRGGLTAVDQRACDTFNGSAGAVLDRGLTPVQGIVDLGTAVLVLLALFSYLRDETASERA